MPADVLALSLSLCANYSLPFLTNQFLIPHLVLREYPGVRLLVPHGSSLVNLYGLLDDAGHLTELVGAILEELRRQLT